MRITLKVGTAASQVARQKSADPWKYHAGDKSAFWTKFRRALVINPDSTSGNPITSMHRYPPPASREEVFSVPPSQASDPAQNSYYDRDFRRRYPRLDVITQSDLSSLLLAQPEGLNLPAPSNKPAETPASTSTDVATVTASAPSLASLYYAGSSGTTTASGYTPSKLPPLPASGVKLEWTQSIDKVQPDPYTYFPMENYSSRVVTRGVVADHDSERTGIPSKSP